jgi:hypothetical protein
MGLARAVNPKALRGLRVFHIILHGLFVGSRSVPIPVIPRLLVNDKAENEE